MIKAAILVALWVGFESVCGIAIVNGVDFLSDGDLIVYRRAEEVTIQEAVVCADNRVFRDVGETIGAGCRVVGYAILRISVRF